MKYLSKGIVLKGSTEKCLMVSRGRFDFTLTKIQADLWLNGRYEVAEADLTDPYLCREFELLHRKQLIEVIDLTDAGIYRALTECVITPVKTKKTTAFLPAEQRNLLKWMREAGLRLTMAELVFITENKMNPEEKWLGVDNRQALTEAIYTRETIFNTVLEAQMEHASARNEVVRNILSLIKRKKVILL